MLFCLLWIHHVVLFQRKICKKHMGPHWMPARASGGNADISKFQLSWQFVFKKRTIEFPLSWQFEEKKKTIRSNEIDNLFNMKLTICSKSFQNLMLPIRWPSPGVISCTPDLASAGKLKCSHRHACQWFCLGGNPSTILVINEKVGDKKAVMNWTKNNTGVLL